MVLERYSGACGDGIADDTEALQDALRGGSLWLAPGRYRISRPLEVNLAEAGPASIAAAGAATLLMTGSGPAVRLIGTHAGSAEPTTVRATVWQRERMPVVSGVEIVGAHPEADGVELCGTIQATLTGLLIRECRHAIHLVCRNRNVIISACHLYHNSGVGVFLDRVNLHQINVHACHVSYNAGGGVVARGSEVRNLQVVGNDIEYNYDANAAASADVWIEAGERGVREGTLCGNTIQALPSSGGANVRISGPGSGCAAKASLFSITGNHISSQEVNLHLQRARGIVVEGNTFQSGYEHALLARECEAITIGPNVFDHNPDYPRNAKNGVRLDGCRGAQLVGLRIDRCQAGTADGGGSLEILRSAEVSVTSVQILNPAHRGIEVLDSRHCMIQGCHVRDAHSQPVMLQAIRVIGGGGNWVANNFLGRGALGALYMEAGTGDAVQNRIV